jgi:SAM-dependent methyltransferase
MTNVEQVRYWNEEGGDAWVDHQDNMDVQLAPFANALYDASGVRGGDRAFDIGCGCGTTTLQLAQLVGPSGRAVGADISRSMIERARERAAQSGRANTRFVVADAQTAPLPGEFDVVASRFGVMFFEDPTAAFANMRRAVRPHGRLAFVCWRSPAENEWASGMGRIVRELLPLAPPPDPNAPGPFAFADDARIRSILHTSGWADVRVEARDHPMVLFGASNLHDAVSGSLQIGPAARALSGPDADDVLRAKVAAAVSDFFAPHLTDRGVLLNGAVWVVTARNH